MTVSFGIILSFVVVFFTRLLGLSGLSIFILIGLIASKFFARELELATVGELTKKLARENYRRLRRNSSTVNRSEIAQKVKELFQEELQLEDVALSREANF